MLKILCSYLPDFEICQSTFTGDMTIVFQDNGDFIHKVKEVKRITDFADMTEEELLCQCDDYDYSGELLDGSAYCFWKLVNDCLKSERNCDMKLRVTQIVECTNYDTTYGYIIADEKYDVQAEINRIKHDPDFIEEYYDDWCIDDIFDRFSFNYNWLTFDVDCIACI